MPVNTLCKKHTHTHTHSQMAVRGMRNDVCMYLCMYVCTKGAANRAQKATELRNSGSRPNDNCFLALVAENTCTHT